MTCKSIRDLRLQQRRERSLWRTRKTAASPQARFIQIGDRELLNFCSNDYLGLANHPALIDAGVNALQQYGAGSGASHLVCGHSELHQRLESKLAEFVGAAAALTFSTGYMANLAIPQTLLDRHGLLLQDKLNHASLLDAGQLSLAQMTRYPHADHALARQLLQQSTAQQKMIMTDGVFSMDGDVAPVAKLNQACIDHDALLVVDDAHGWGVMGATGAGCLSAAGISITEHVLMVGTLGKSAGSFGAFVAGDAEWIETLIQFARPYIYTTAMPPVIAATALAAIELMQTEPQRRQRLLVNVASFRRLATAANLPISQSRTPIQPLIVGESETALQISERLWDAGIWVSAIRPPTVPAGSARLRITITAEHTTEDLERLVAALGNE